MREISVDLPALGKPIEADVGEQLQLQAQQLLFARLARLGTPRRAVGGGDEARVAASAAAALGDEDALALLGEIGEQAQLAVVGILLEDERADRHGDLEIVRGLAGPVGALAVLAAAGLELGMEAEVDERVLAWGWRRCRRSRRCRRRRRRDRRAGRTSRGGSSGSRCRRRRR